MRKFGLLMIAAASLAALRLKGPTDERFLQGRPILHLTRTQFTECAGRDGDKSLG
jgi:hypothetical protein